MLCMGFLLVLVSVKVNGQKRPNILILIADDMGTDAMSAYDIGSVQPNTPNLNDMLSEGILFKNTWAYGTCAPSRASLITARHGNKNGVMRSGPNLDNEEITLFEHISDITANDYTDAAFGKWHLGGATHPNDNGVDHYDGNLLSGVDDYFNWERWINGVKDTSDQYVTTYMTDQAIDWVEQQTQPWLLWMAYNAPHGPIHLPPDSLYTRQETSSSFDKYMCMIESVDHEVGRLYSSLSQEEKDSTLVIFVGDNGTPNSKIQGFPQGHGKGSVYEGGINVPMFMMGYGVDRINEEEDALISFTDIPATITELIGTDLPGGMENGFSFYDLLSDPNATTKTYNYSELLTGDLDRAIRNQQYKLIIKDESTFELYDLLVDPFELNDLYANGLTEAEEDVFNELLDEADNIYYSWSCQDDIQNGDEDDIDCGGSNCNNCEEESETIFAHYFENGWDGWTSGGNDCTLHSGAARAYEGNQSIRLRDNAGIESSMTSETFNLANYTDAELSFHFYSSSMEAGENFFLEKSTGNGWELIGDYIGGQDFENNTFTEIIIEDLEVSETTTFKFSCDASNNQDRIFLDAIILKGIQSNSNNVLIDQRAYSQSKIDELFDNDKDLSIFPNPASNSFTINSDSEIQSLIISDANGRSMFALNLPNIKEVDISNLQSGIYYISVDTPEGQKRSKFIKI